MQRVRTALFVAAFAVASAAPAHAVYLSGPSVLSTGNASAGVQEVHRTWKHWHRHPRGRTYFGFSFGVPAPYPYYAYPYYGLQTYYGPYVYRTPYRYRPYGYAYPSHGIYPCPPGDPWRNGCVGY